MKKRKLVSTILATALLVNAGLASAGIDKITYSNELPVFSNNIYLATGNKDDNSKSKVWNSLVGNSYTTNLWIVDSNGKKVSATATKVGDDDTRYFTVDQSAVGKKVTLAAENSSGVFQKVDISGEFYPDTK